MVNMELRGKLADLLEYAVDVLLDLYVNMALIIEPNPVHFDC